MLQVMAKYNALFQHLLRLKRVNAELDAAWASLRHQAGAESLQSRQPVWDVRLHMAHLLLNLQVYMQVRTFAIPYLFVWSALRCHSQSVGSILWRAQRSWTWSHEYPLRGLQPY